MLSARHTVTFLAAEQPRLLDSTELFCLATEALVCERLAQRRYSLHESETAGR